jgi:hypothetical protein
MLTESANEAKPENLWIRCVDIALLLTFTDRNPSGLASEANHKVPIGLTLSLLSLSTIGTLIANVKIISRKTGRHRCIRMKLNGLLRQYLVLWSGESSF